ncbi:hypothetical protein Ddc_13203 [Ditylenchus destructor]|nr:hypothetical protein Ddc_13203 [Ditylenchus destructor]
MCNFIFWFGIILLHLGGTITKTTTLEDHHSEDPVAKYTAELNDHEIDEEAERNKAAVFRAENMLLIGKSALEAGDFDRALLCFNKAYVHQPFNAENLAARAYCHLKMENFYLSFLDANEALKLEPLSRWAQTTKVHSLIGSKRHHQAILHAIEQFHDKELIVHLLEQYKFTLVERGESDAIDPVAIRKMVVDSNDNFDKNNFSKTVELVEKILPHLPYNETLYKGSMAIRMVSLKALERLPEAYMDATELLELDNSDEMSEMRLYLHNTLAELLTGLGRFEAIAEMERGIKAFPNKDKIAESLKQLSKAKMDMSRKYDTILDNTPSGIPSAGHKITELVVGPTQYQVTSADGKKYVAESDSLEEFLQSYHSKITLVVLMGIPFDSEFLGVLASVDDLWTGNFRFAHCDFTQLKEDEIMELFRNTIQPEYMMFISNIGLTSQMLNKALSEHVFDCDLAIVDDRKDQIQLDPNALLEFLHRPVPKNGERQRNFLSLQSEFIEGGVLAFVEQITEHFKTDSDPVSFHLQITQDVELPFYGEKPLENPWTGEFLAQKKQRYTDTVTYTTLDRYHPT